MKGFLLGLVVAGLAFAGYYVYRRQPPNHQVSSAPAVADAGVPNARKHRRRARGANRMVRVASAPAPSGAGREPSLGTAPHAAAQSAPEADPPDPEPVKLSPADLKLVAQGDDLSKPDVMHLDMGDDQGAHELSQDDIDAHFRPQEEAILACISRARPDPESYVPGRVTVKFRIQRTGRVRGVRVEAPAILQKGGIYGCIKGVVGRIAFPASNGSQVVSYPYSLS